MKSLILYGAGGLSDNVREILGKDYDVIGYLDEEKTGWHHGLKILGSKPEDIEDFWKYSYFVSVGYIDVKKRFFENLKARSLEIVNCIDKTARIFDGAKIGEGNYIGPHVAICADVVIGDNNYINCGAVIEHGSRIGNHCRIAANASVNGETIVQDEVFIGSGAVINGDMEIGRGAVVGSGAVVTRSVESLVTVVGVPAKPIRRTQ